MLELKHCLHCGLDRAGSTMPAEYDDVEDDMPDPAFGRPIPMQSKESELPLRDFAANPAGHSSLSFGQPSGFGPGAPGGEQRRRRVC